MLPLMTSAPPGPAGPVDGGVGLLAGKPTPLAKKLLRSATPANWNDCARKFIWIWTVLWTPFGAVAVERRRRTLFAVSSTKVVVLAHVNCEKLPRLNVSFHGPGNGLVLSPR